MTAMTNQEATTSSLATPAASRTTYCPDVSAIDDPNVMLFDFMDHSFIRAVYALPIISAVEWISGANLTAVSYDFYSYTNYCSIILLYNGYISESHIPHGATLNIPDVSGLKASLTVSNRGKVTRI